jgi:chromosome segregation ATPase
MTIDDPTYPFEEIVEKDTHSGATAAEAAWLRRPAHAQRWYALLIRKKTEIEAKIADLNAQMQTRKQEFLKRHDGRAKDEWFQLKANMEERRASHNRVRTRVEERIREAKLLLQSLGQEPDALKNRAQLLDQEVRRLTLEIARAEEQIRFAEETFAVVEQFPDRAGGAVAVYRAKYPKDAP